jgi:branched-chain amino acid transport system substrate-binding protein
MRPTRTLIAAVVTAFASLPIVVATQSPLLAAAAAPLTIALITSKTGEAAVESTGSAVAFTARIDAQNAAGGVDGHKLVPLVLDDQSSPTEVATVVQEAIAKGAIGIVADSALFFLADKYPQQAGIPVTGSNSDGPEWGEQPFTNMFASDFGSVDPTYPASTLEGKVMKMLNVTKAATYGYGISPNSARAVKYDTESMQRYGIAVPVQNSSVPFGGVDFTSDALVAKNAGVNGLFPNLLDSSDYALATSYKQAGVKLKAAVFPTGLTQSIIKTPVWANVQGDYFMALYHPFDLPNAGTQKMQSALEKYAHFAKSQFPGYSQYESYIGADLLIQGLQKAGANLTRSGVIKALRSIKSYNADGLLPVTINYSTIFGHEAPQCVWLFRAEKSGFALVQKNDVCGESIPGTSTASG